MQQYKVLVLDRLPDYGLNYLRSKLPSNFTLTDNLEEADFVLGGPGGIGKLSKSPEDIRAATRKVKLIQSTSAGYDNVDVGALSLSGLPFATNDGANSVAARSHLGLRVEDLRQLQGQDPDVGSVLPTMRTKTITQFQGHRSCPTDPKINLF